MKNGGEGRGTGQLPKSRIPDNHCARGSGTRAVERRTIMKLSLSAVSVGAALACAAVPLSLQWSPAKAPSLSLDRAEARVGRPLTATSVAGVNRRVARRTARRTAAGAVVGAAAVGAATTAAYVGAPGPYYGPAPGPYYGPGPAPYPPAPAYGPPVAAGYGPGAAPGGATIVNPVTGRWCTTYPSGFQWCWTP